MVLVEFGDYECPPCRNVYRVLESWLNKHQNIECRFHHFPLKFHPLARPAALASLMITAIHVEGIPSEMHQLLFTKNIREEDITDDFRHLGFTRFALRGVESTALQLLQDDLNLAKELKVAGTPTFFLILSASEAYQVTNLEDLLNSLES